MMRLIQLHDVPGDNMTVRLLVSRLNRLSHAHDACGGRFFVIHHQLFGRQTFLLHTARPLLRKEAGLLALPAYLQLALGCSNRGGDS